MALPPAHQGPAPSARLPRRLLRFSLLPPSLTPPLPPVPPRSGPAAPARAKAPHPLTRSRSAAARAGIRRGIGRYGSRAAWPAPLARPPAIPSEEPRPDRLRSTGARHVLAARLWPLLLPLWIRVPPPAEPARGAAVCPAWPCCGQGM